MGTLTAAPFNLVRDQSVFAKVVAVNHFGDGDPSPAGNGATVVLVPDPPVGLASNAALTSEDRISLAWAQGQSNGGMPVLDFRITFDQSVGNYVTLAEGLSWKDPAGRTRTETELADWIGKRAGAGRMAPRGFPRDNKFN